MSEDILYDIEMQLYMEFNDDIATMYDHLGDIYSYKDIEDKKQAEQQRKIELMGNAIKQLQNNWNELKKWLENGRNYRMYLFEILDKMQELEGNNE